MSDTDRSQGYVTDTTYVEKFFRELSPVWLNYVAALNGVRPRPVDKPFTYLELGCGFGASAIVNAGAFPEGEFHACDINPSHIQTARTRAAEFGITLQFHEASFQELLARDLPLFDFIVLHGVYSWVGPGARHAVRQIIDRKLKHGGLVYISYNCFPGWSIEAPLRKLLVELASGETGNTAERAAAGLKLLENLSVSKLRYLTSNPATFSALDSYIKGPSNYLVHEFLNEAWEPFYSVDVAEEMAAIGLSYAGSATLADNHLTLIVNDTAAGAVARLNTPQQRQLAMDFAVDRRFRRDVFVRGAGPEPAAVSRYLPSTVIGTIDNPARITAKVKVPRGVVSFQQDFTNGVQAVLVHGSIPLGDAVTALSSTGGDKGEVLRNLTFLIAAGVLMPFAKEYDHDQSTAATSFANPTVERILAYIVVRGADGALPSEVVGNGVPISPAEALSVLTFISGARPVDQLAASLKEECLLRDLKSPADNFSSAPETNRPDWARLTAQKAEDELVLKLIRGALLM
ncbi:MAG TPA: class I SAM-dependent methyltransferase [Blastocatellia bacterium]